MLTLIRRSLEVTVTTLGTTCTAFVAMAVCGVSMPATVTLSLLIGVVTLGVSIVMSTLEG